MKTLTIAQENQKIRECILANKTLSNDEIASIVGYPKARIGGNIAYLKRSGKFNDETQEKTLTSETSKLEKLLSQVRKKIDTNTNTYKGGGENKEVARVKMSNHVTDSGIVGEVPTLPNTDWTIEQKIANQLPDMKFIGAEIDKPTYNKMRKNLKDTSLNATTHFGKIGELIYGKTEDTYAHLILDYCGHLSTFSKEIEYAIINNIIKVGGIMAITFGKPLRGLDSQTTKIKGLAPINNGDERCVSDRGIENYFAKITGWNYEVKEIFYYSDKKESGKGYPMTLVIIKRIK
jgi:hypothetical protein